MYIAGLDKSETYPEVKLLPEKGLCKYLYKPGEQHRDQLLLTSFLTQ